MRGTETWAWDTEAMKIALSLGSGGARGYAHIGIIEELEARGHEIVAVAGASMGALVGGVYAAGKLPEFRDWANALTQSAVLRLLDPTLLGPGVIKADRVVGEVADILGNVLIEDLAIPYTAVATDLTAKREVWFQQGPLAMAIRASIAIPSVITPVNLNGHILADGGVMNPVPLEPLAPVSAEATVAVTLRGKPSAIRTVTAADAEERPDWAERFWRSAAELVESDLVKNLAARLPRKDKPSIADLPDGDSTPKFDELPDHFKLADVISGSLDVMEGTIERYRMAANPADVLISIPHDTASTYDFHRAATIADVGREKAIAAFDAAGM